jgi:hypothetical protein
LLLVYRVKHGSCWVMLLCMFSYSPNKPQPHAPMWGWPKRSFLRTWCLAQAPPPANHQSP